MSLHIAIVGAGWAGMAAAVHTTLAGHRSTVFEAAQSVGGRARALPCTLPDGSHTVLDNGQHILIGAYSETLRLMQCVGVDLAQTLLRLPLDLKFADGSGMRLPAWPRPWDTLAAILGASGWRWHEKIALLRTAVRWQASGFRCDSRLSVAALCQHLPARIVSGLIEPLCISALNTPLAHASAQVFLHTLRDALFGPPGSSNLLLPSTDMGQLFPETAAHWLRAHGMQLHLGQRIATLRYQAAGPDASTHPSIHAPTHTAIHATSSPASATSTSQSTNQPANEPALGKWYLNEQAFDRVIWATGANHAAQTMSQQTKINPAAIATALHHWSQTAQRLRYEAIATVYAYAPQVRLPKPMLALHSTAQQPAQFVFDRGQLGGPAGLLAFVVSACQAERRLLQSQVLAQGQQALASYLQGRSLCAVQTVVEKRATFACTPGLVRPEPCIAPGLWACGDYIAGPYPATLEGAVRSGIAAAQQACLDTTR